MTVHFDMCDLSRNFFESFDWNRFEQSVATGISESKDELLVSIWTRALTFIKPVTSFAAGIRVLNLSCNMLINLPDLKGCSFPLLTQYTVGCNKIVEIRANDDKLFEIRDVAPNLEILDIRNNKLRDISGLSKVVSGLKHLKKLSLSCNESINWDGLEGDDDDINEFNPNSVIGHMCHLLPKDLPELTTLSLFRTGVGETALNYFALTSDIQIKLGLDWVEKLTLLYPQLNKILLEANNLPLDTLETINANINDRKQ